MEGRVLDTRFSTIGYTQFTNYLASEIRGLWFNLQKAIGGPVINYSFYDEKTSRIYMIDMQLFAPSFTAEKEPLIRQMEIIANTFTTHKKEFESN